ncbi:unnamed protein product [Lampetra planeri]
MSAVHDGRGWGGLFFYEGGEEERFGLGGPEHLGRHGSGRRGSGHRGSGHRGSGHRGSGHRGPTRRSPARGAAARRVALAHGVADGCPRQRERTLWSEPNRDPRRERGPSGSRGSDPAPEAAPRHLESRAGGRADRWPRGRERRPTALGGPSSGSGRAAVADRDGERCRASRRERGVARLTANADQRGVP